MTNKKVDIGKLFDCSDISTFAMSIVQVLPYRGYSNSRFYMCELHGVKFLTKLSFYRKTAPELYSKKNDKVIPQVDAEILILKLLRDKIIESNISPCILELVTDKVCKKVARIAPSARECEKLIIDYNVDNLPDNIDQLFCKYNNLVKHGLAHDKCAFLVLEKCDMVFDEYVQKSINSPVGISVFKSILFMIIHVFWAISKIYPGFRHYDLHTDNILLKFDSNYKFNASIPKFLVFPVDDKRYYVPYFGIMPKVIDFGFGIIPEEDIYSNITEDKYLMYHKTENDLLFLFYHIYNSAHNTANIRLKEIEDILSALEPNGTYKHYYTEYIRKVEKSLLTYDQMLHNDVFAEYIKYDIPKEHIYAEYYQPKKSPK